MKTNPNGTILRLLNSCGVHIDASSGYECLRAIRAGFAPSAISLSSQEWFKDFRSLHEQGVTFNACSLHQIRQFGELFPGGELGLRFNPGVGSGANRKTDVGGPSSSFGIWHAQLPQVKALVEEYQLKVYRIHTHIGSGSDPSVWQRVSALSLNLCKEFPDVRVLNLGGGFKVGRMKHEVSTDLQAVGAPVKSAFESFAKETGRQLKLEIEPGTFLMANNGALLCTVQDMTHTLTETSDPSASTISKKEEGYRFLKLDTGMTEIMRPSLYGAQHPVVIVPRPSNEAKSEDEYEQYVAVGHCCESGDLITTAPGVPDLLQPRVCRRAQIGDVCVIEGCGSYCASMSAGNYNSFPLAAEVMLMSNGDIKLIRRRQTLEQVTQNEIEISL